MALRLFSMITHRSRGSSLRESGLSSPRDSGDLAPRSQHLRAGL